MPSSGPFEHRVEPLGPGPLLHHFLERTRLPEILRRHLSAPITLRTLLLLHNFLQAREPLYALLACAARYPPQAMGRRDPRPL